MYTRENREKALLACFSLLFFAYCFVSCESGPEKAKVTVVKDDVFTIQLRSSLRPFDTTNKKTFRSVADDVRFTYQSHGYRPIWIGTHYKPTDAAAKLIDELEDTYWDGLDTTRYKLTALKNLKEKLDTTRENSLSDAIAFDTALTHCYLLAAKNLLLGTIAPKTADSLWYHINDSSWYAPQLLVSARSYYPSLDTFRSRVPTYSLLREAYKHYTELANDTLFTQALSLIQSIKHPDSEELDIIRKAIGYEMPWVTTIPNDSVSEEKQLFMAYQAYSGLQQSGKPDTATIARLATPVDSLLQKIKANMERVRWMQRQFGDLYLVVNVPLMELFLRKDGLNKVHMRVVVGRPERQTPSLYANMADVVINPPWGVPPTILKNDVLPGLQKSGKKYMDKKGLKAYDRKGQVIRAANINARNYKNYYYQQAPGNDNSLGYVKFNLPNRWDIYLHDTPHRGDFGKRFRALSSGCIRLQRPLDMAVYILADLEKKNYTLGRLDTVIKTHRTRWELLKTKIPVHITYLTVFEDTTGKHIQFVRDVYHRDDKLISLMN